MQIRKNFAICGPKISEATQTQEQGAKNNRSVSKNFKHNHGETKLHHFHHSGSASGLKLVAAMSKGRGAAKLAATRVMDVPSWSIRPAQEDTVIESSLESGDRGQAATQWLATVESGARAGDGDGSGSFDNMYEAYWQDKLKDVPPGQVVDVDETCRPPNDMANGQDGDAAVPLHNGTPETKGGGATGVLPNGPLTEGATGTLPNGTEVSDGVPVVGALSAEQLETAQRNYRLAKGETVEWATIAASAEGGAHWLTCHMDMRARGSVAQQFGRALKWSPQWNSMYPHLTEKYKQEFRAAWAVQRNWEFTKEVRQVIQSESKRTEDLGEMLPEVSIAAALGDCSNAACQTMAAAYCQMAQQMGGKFVGWSQWLNAPTYLYIRRLLSTTSTKEWRQAVESSVTTNLWEDRVRMCKAQANYGRMNNMKAELVTQEMLNGTKLGIQGWADVQSVVMIDNTAQSENGTEAKGKAKAKPKAKTESKDNTAAKAERDAKEFLATMTTAICAKERFVHMYEENQEGMQWCADFVKKMEAAHKCISDREAEFEEFPGDLRAAALSPNSMRKARKTYGDEWVPKLISFKERLQEPTTDLDVVVNQVQSMRSAQGSNSRDAETTPCKRQASGVQSTAKKHRN